MAIGIQEAERRVASARRTGTAVLDLSGLKLTSLPESLGNLSNLTTLDVSYNQLTSLPESLGNLSNLTTLVVSDNKLTSLPESLGNLSNLTTLVVSDNKLTSPPPEVVIQGTIAILEHLRSLSKDGKEHWCSKMLIVGQGGGGKTNLLRRLKGEPFNESEDTTHGIEIRELEMAHPERSDIMMTLNVWDFAGQEINHATHQFFLSNRSLFVLVWNARQEYLDGRINYWLETIRAKAGGDVPILIVATHIDQRVARLPMDTLYRDYPQIVDYCEVSNKTGEGFDVLRKKIQEFGARLPLMGERISGRWVHAMEAVRNLSEAQKSLPQPDFEALILSHGLSESEAKVLTQWMHDLGDILHFKDRAELSDTVIIKPQWVTQHIAKVLNSEAVKGEEGIFTKTEMNRLWKDLDVSERECMLAMMEQFDLSYRIPEDNLNRSLVVECVSWDEAKYQKQWEAKAGEQEVSLHYELSSLPAGLPTWTIARAHRFTQHLHWKRGALFGDAQDSPSHLALISASDSAKTVQITARGATPIYFFGLIRDTFEVTLNRFPGLKDTCTKMVPCNCSPNCTHRYNLKNLENRLNRKGIIECEVTAIDVNVASLLYGIGHHTQPAYLEAKFNALDRRFDQLDLEVANWRRDFLKEFRNEQRLEESRCPNVFVLREKPLENEASLYEQGKERVSRLSHRPLELHLCCQYPKQWHLTEEGGKYPIQQPREYIKTLAPVVSKLVTILKYTTPLVGATIGAFSTELAEAMKHDFKFMEAWVKALPDIGKEEYFEQLEIGSDQPYYREELSPDRVSPVRGADLRPLKVMLEKLDDQKIWGGLTWTPTPEGDYLWLCKEHAKEFA